jgi:hypothetical protein
VPLRAGSVCDVRCVPVCMYPVVCPVNGVGSPAGRLPYAFLSAHEFLYPALELRAWEQHLVVAPGAAHAYVRADPHDLPVITAAWVGLTQGVYVSKPDIERLHNLGLVQLLYRVVPCVPYPPYPPTGCAGHYNTQPLHAWFLYLKRRDTEAQR